MTREGELRQVEGLITPRAEVEEREMKNTTSALRLSCHVSGIVCKMETCSKSEGQERDR